MSISVAMDWLVAVLLASARVMPPLAFAPPFSLMRIPVHIRALLGLMLAACLVQFGPNVIAPAALTSATLVSALLGELVIGVGIVFAFQSVAAALYFGGRVLDIQAGFGLATVIDPATRGQLPLLGSLFAFGAGAIFFAVDGHHQLLRVIAVTMEVAPVGSGMAGWPVAEVVAQFGGVFTLGLAVAGVGMLVMLLADIALGFMSRGLPQMNILVLGMQVKTLLLLLVLMLMTGLLTPVVLRGLESALRFVAHMGP